MHSKMRSEHIRWLCFLPVFQQGTFLTNQTDCKLSVHDPVADTNCYRAALYVHTVLNNVRFKLKVKTTVGKMPLGRTRERENKMWEHAK